MPARAATASRVFTCLLVLNLVGLAGTATWAAEDERPGIDPQRPQAAESRGPAEAAPAAGTESADYQTRARQLAREILIIDGHVDAPYAQQEAPADVSVEAPDRQFDYPRARAGGLDAPFMSIFTPPRLQAEKGASKQLADELIDWVEQLVADHPDKFAIPTSAAEVEAHFAAGKISLPMGLENGAPIEDDLANLRHFHQRGIRYVTLTHSEPNLISDSSFSQERPWQGLSPFGREVVAEMNRLGIMVDVSHVSDDAFYQVMELSQAPVIASHSSCRKFTPGWERNIADDMIRRLAEKGGVVQITFGSGFLLAEANRQDMAYWPALVKFRQESGARHGSPEEAKFNEEYWRDKARIWADVSHVADHVDHVVGLVGIDHVGLGSDFDGLGDSAPTGLKDVSGYPNLIAELLARGYSEQDLRKICGGNLLRVWKEVERVAAELRSRT